ncbi:MAG: hypothetical protein GY903_17635 [Fuerstiella sp.]|nr:hypothetical protein [Fuerstiella sp.]MCP4856306.1 hypothetical protein [Fuerstiella sp.]
MKPPQTRPSFLFRLVIPATVIFILTILALIASIFGDPQAPVSQWLEAHGDDLLIWELIAVLVVAVLAMTVDRWRSLHGIEEAPVAPSQPTGSDTEDQDPLQPGTANR